MKKHPSLAFDSLDGGASGSIPTNGDATSVPISRRLFLWALFGSVVLVTSSSCDVPFGDTERRAQ